MLPSVDTGGRNAVVRQVRRCAAVQTPVNCHCQLEKHPVWDVEPYTSRKLPTYLQTVKRSQLYTNQMHLWCDRMWNARRGDCKRGSGKRESVKNAGLEKAGVEFSAPKSTSGKRGSGNHGTRIQGWKTREKRVWKAKMHLTKTKLVVDHWK